MEPEIDGRWIGRGRRFGDVDVEAEGDTSVESVFQLEHLHRGHYSLFCSTCRAPRTDPLLHLALTYSYTAQRTLGLDGDDDCVKLARSLARGFGPGLRSTEQASKQAGSSGQFSDLGCLAETVTLNADAIVALYAYISTLARTGKVSYTVFQNDPLRRRHTPGGGRVMDLGKHAGISLDEYVRPGEFW